MYTFLLLSLFIFGVQISYLVLSVRNDRKGRVKTIVHNTIVSFVLSVAVVAVQYYLMTYNRPYLSDCLRSLLVILTFLEVFFLSKNLMSNIEVDDDKHKILSKVSSILGSMPDDSCVSSGDIITGEHISYKDKIIKLLVPVCYIIYILFVSKIFEIYLTNIYEWDFTYRAIALPVLVGVVSALVLIAIIIIFLDKKAIDRLFFILSILSILFYIQDNLLNGKIFIKGKYIESDWGIIIVDSLIWTVLLLVAFYIKYSKKRELLFKYIVLFLLVIQIPVLPSLFFSNKKNNEEIKYELDGIDQFQVGSEENVIVFILDAFYANYFDYFIEDYPEYNYIFKDFIYYDNMNSRACGTTQSVPCMLTAKDIDYSMSIMDSNALNWNSDTASYFYDSMHNAGYTINLYTDSALYAGGINNMIGKIDNIVEHKGLNNETDWKSYKGLFKLSMFRITPYLIKNAFCVLDSSYINHSKEYISEFKISDDPTIITELSSEYNEGDNIPVYYMNNAFYSSLKVGLNDNHFKKGLIIQHIYGMHEEYTPLRDIHYPDGMQDGEKAVIGCFTILQTYFDELKRLGVYDNSTIIVTADHGINVLSMNRPIMLVKQQGQVNDAFSICSAPGDLQSDLLPTILDCAGYEVPDFYEGYSLLDIEEEQHRNRVTLVFDFSSQYPAVKKCNGMGDSIMNCYRKYIYDGDIRTYNFDNAEYEERVITDFWW